MTTISHRSISRFLVTHSIGPADIIGVHGVKRDYLSTILGAFLSATPSPLTMDTLQTSLVEPQRLAVSGVKGEAQAVEEAGARVEKAITMTPR